MTTDTDLRSRLVVVGEATLERPKRMRHALASFMTAIDVAEETQDDILTAVGEALANAVEHGHAPGTPGRVTLTASLEHATSLVIEVRDDGRFLPRSEPRPFGGFGLRIMGAIAREMSVEADGGTRVRMRFELG